MHLMIYAMVVEIVKWHAPSQILKNSILGNQK